MTRSKELRRIEAAIAHKNEAELRWALSQCDIRKTWQTRSDFWHRIERKIRAALEEISGEQD